MENATRPSLDNVLKDWSMVVTYIPQDLALIEDSRGRFKRSDLSKQRLKYEVTLNYKGREVLKTPYSMGIGHVPGYTGQKILWNHSQWEEMKGIFKTGKCDPKWVYRCMERNFLSRTTKIEPTLKDVLYCLVMDGGAIDHATFESWAGEYGYDTDSRSAEQTYRACLETGLKLRAALGDQGLSSLREAYQDY